MQIAEIASERAMMDASVPFVRYVEDSDTQETFAPLLHALIAMKNTQPPNAQLSNTRHIYFIHGEHPCPGFPELAPHGVQRAAHRFANDAKMIYR